MAGTIYLLHFEQPVSARHTTRHYLGYCEDLDARLERHRAGDGARLMAVLAERGIGFVLARTWSGGRELERRLKRRHNSPKLCPLCRGGGK